ncbi:UDP-3-O-(3-hydroxymyristoyl)glucosamine N-acyltransferase [Neiella marina]|uniref:UDP-3-O-acylglucosamine N-acyltransferase n=1 Tax=Neiella holothuriorum TaxID=2870530 RepID=A0ABS7EEX9_9GAMM|nr:UDP-3-O-(3-hydroxymyristoyl)glucosamine N-acyltransferase [Neiella holothuriorum]MBW8190885.1 UDP-3-O-(3-hydroxymyristoyl)glucosamine N-acyltransferase [Neiella holothuriorum]
MTSITLSVLAEHIGADIDCDGSAVVVGLNTLENANAQQVSFLANKKYKSQLADTNALAVIVSPKEAALISGRALIMDNPYLGYAKAAQLLDNSPVPASTIHPTAFVDDSAVIGANVHIGPNATVDAEVVIGDDSSIGAGSYVGVGSSLGKGVTIKPNVTLYHHVVLGHGVTVHSNTVIGSDGFGFANDKGCWEKIPQVGRVVIGDGTDIGASVTIDRGALDDTTIGKGAIIDNQVQIGHNCQIGDYTAIAGASGIAGSTKVGNYCIIGGAVSMNGHIEICDGVHITGNSMIAKSIDKPGVYSSGIPATDNREWRRGVNRYNQLGDLFKRVKSLEQHLNEPD